MREAITVEDPNSTANVTHGPSSRLSTTRSIERSFSMSKGEGEDSYSKNSSPQAWVVNKFVHPVLNRALERVILPAHGPVVVTDLGCSSGPNAIDAVTFIVKKLRARFRDSASPTPEFQAFFNDLSSNDFNNLFELLSTSETKGDFFAGGVPGSFYRRLFPRSSVHVFFSANCLHWLSQIPDAVLDKQSPAYNKGKIWVHGSSLATGTTYKEQASSDLKTFLDARAAELVPGGLLFLFMVGRPTREPNEQVEDVSSSLGPVTSSLHECCWTDLISEGVLTEEQRDTFNLPSFHRSLEEVMETVERCGSDFDVVVAKKFRIKNNFARMFQTVEPVELSNKSTAWVKAAMNSPLEEHVGKEAASLYWQHFQQLFQKNEVPLVLANPERHDWFHILALVRK